MKSWTDNPIIYGSTLLQVKKFKPSLVSVKSASLVPALKEALAGMDVLPEIMFGEEGMVEV